MRQQLLKSVSTHLKGGVSTVVVGAVMLTAPTSVASAQDADSDDDDEQVVETITVTGSRIRRNEFTSPSPLQRLEADESRKIGIVNITDMLQRSSLANGNQIDATINTNAGNSNATEAPPAGGVGSANIDLRGLGPERTLVLMNGRRIGASGVRGAPSQPDLNMIPFSMVSHVEMITEGASSVYGADAVAGVVNVILKDDFEGFDLSANFSDPKGLGGKVKNVSGTFGGTTDRGSYMIGFEYYDRERIRTGDRRDCLETIEESESGEIFRGCRSGFFDNVIGNFNGSPATPEVFFFATPGSTNIGVDGFSDYTALAVPGAPFTDPMSWRRFPYIRYYGDQDDRAEADYVQPITRFSVVGTADYELDLGFADSEAYMEFYYTNRHLTSTAAGEQIYMDMPGFIPQEDASGNIIVDGTGAPVLVANPWNPFGADVTPIITLADNPQIRRTEVQTVRMVGGLRGDFNNGWMAENNWSYDMFISYDRGTGAQAQQMMNEGNLALSMGTLRLDSGGNLICGHAAPATTFGFYTQEQCVPVNMLAPSIFDPSSEGRLATQAERDWLFGDRTNRTVTEQYNAQFFMTGDLFEMPTGGGMASVAIGFEARKDTIDSQNSRDGVVGDLAGENPLPEGNTIGGRTLKEFFAEIALPFVTGKEGVDYLALDAAIRHTDESNFGTGTTERFRVTYRPVDYMQLSGSYGTSFRAPNMREQFLAGQGGGLGGLADPCHSTNGGGGAVDDRPQLVLDNCIAAGVDPTTLGNSGTPTIPFTSAGNADLLAETSRSYTTSFKFSQPWDDSFDLSLAVSYWNIRINNTVRESDPAQILGQCYGSLPGLQSAFCDFITRGTAGFITNVQAGFINVGLERASGYDFNTRLAFTLGDVGGEPMDITWSTVSSHLKSRVTRVLEDSPEDELAGRISFPKWRFDSTIAMNWKNIGATWVTRIIGKQQGNDDDLGDFDQFANLPIGTLTRPYGTVPTTWYHDLAFNYTWDRVSFNFGMRNVFDKQPPTVGAGPNRMNSVSGGGYDFFGRTAFFNVKTSF